MSEVMFVVAAALGIFLLGCWLSEPLSSTWRWLGRLLLGAVLAALLMPASSIQQILAWLQPWLPASGVAATTPGADWIVHFASFAALGLWLFHCRRDLPARWTVSGLIILGGLTEALQYLVPGRSASAADWLADGIGVGLAWLTVRYAVRHPRARLCKS